MKKIYAILLVLAFFVHFCHAQWTAGLQYSQDLSASALENRLFPEEINTNIDICFSPADPCGGFYNTEFRLVNNSTTSINIAYKSNRWQLGCSLDYQVRNFETYAFINSVDEQKNTTYITSRYNDIFRQPIPVSNNSISENSYYLQQQRYLGVTPSLNFYWLNRPKFKSYIHTALTFSEKYSRANQTELLATSDYLLAYRTGLGFEHSLGQLAAIQYGVNYQRTSVDFLTEIEDFYKQKLTFISPFLQLNYRLFN